MGVHAGLREQGGRASAGRGRATGHGALQQWHGNLLRRHEVGDVLVAQAALRWPGEMGVGGQQMGDTRAALQQ